MIKNLDGLGSVLYIFKILPKSFGDYIYDMIAKRRYVLFGEKEIWVVPVTGIGKKFRDW